MLARLRSGAVIAARTTHPGEQWMAIFGRRKEDGTSALEPEVLSSPARDSDFGVPPFRPAAKETSAMPIGPKPSNPAPVLRPSPMAMPARPAMPPPRSDGAERRTLVVGRGISLQGTVADAERLEVEGTVESQMIQAAELLVAASGVFKGEVQVDEAEVAGLFDGTITARVSLTIRATGRVNGIARCRRLSVEEGGQVSGRMEMLSDDSGGGLQLPPPPAPMGSASGPAPLGRTDD